MESFKLLLTIPGIGKDSAIAILAEIYDISYFKNAKQLAAYAGVTPKNIISGSSVRGKSRLSKIGSKLLRCALFFPGIVTKNHNSIVMAFCKKLKDRGKHNMAIVGAAIRKLLHIIFGVLKSKSAFNPSFLSFSC